MADEETTYSTNGLDQLLKALKAKPPVARIGILGASNARSGKEDSNATIGAAHEFGTSKIPMRSFLRVPITDNLSREMESAGLNNKKILEEVIRSGSLFEYVDAVAIVAHKIVLEAFTSDGYGKWKSLNTKYSSWKDKKFGTGNILVATEQLRDSITYDVKR